MNIKPTLLTSTLTAILAISLTACGGGGGSSSNTTTGTVDNSNNSGSGDSATSASFSESATWVVNASQSNIGEICYDFDSKAEVGCTGVNWDIKFDNQARSKSLWTNSGTSGEGNGGAFGMLKWSGLQQYTNATTKDGRDFANHYKADATQSVFGENKWYEYNLQDAHQIYPNYKVYIVTTDSSNASSRSSVQMPVYALQIINYYNESGDSGHLTLRYIDTSMPDKVVTKTYDASSYSDWVYVDLATGDTVAEDGNWQIALKRTNLKLNGGDSGNGTVAGVAGVQPEGFYDAEGNLVTAQFTSDQSATSLSALTDTAGYLSDDVKWVSDGFSSVLNPDYTGTYPNLDYGWYTYDGTTHQLSAKAESEADGALIRSGEGNSYARMWLKEINNNTGEWTFVMDVQPAQ